MLGLVSSRVISQLDNRFRVTYLIGHSGQPYCVGVHMNLETNIASCSVHNNPNSATSRNVSVVRLNPAGREVESADKREAESTTQQK